MRVRAWQGGDQAAYVDWIDDDGNVLRSVFVGISSDRDQLIVSDVAPADRHLVDVRLTRPRAPLDRAMTLPKPVPE